MIPFFVEIIVDAENASVCRRVNPMLVGRLSIILIPGSWFRPFLLFSYCRVVCCTADYMSSLCSDGKIR